MATTSTCPECRKGKLTWETRRRGDLPVDVFACDSCGYVLAEEDWQLPLLPLRPGRCRNCGGLVRTNLCVACGLHVTEDVAVHEELRQLVHPTADALSAARLAVAMGRKLVALKLATAAAADGPSPADARALRIRLLQEIGEEASALSDARQWTQDAPNDAPAWASAALAFGAASRTGEAIAAYARALEIDPTDVAVRARFARLLLDVRRFGQALEQAYQVLASPGDRQATLTALEVVAEYTETLVRHREVLATREVLTRLGARTRNHVVFLCASAWLADQDGDAQRAASDLVAARRLQGDHPLVGELAASVRPPRRSWWGW